MSADRKRPPHQADVAPTSHGHALQIRWGAAEPLTRGRDRDTNGPAPRNVIGSHRGYAIYRAGIAAGALDRHRADSPTPPPRSSVRICSGRSGADRLPRSVRCAGATSTGLRPERYDIRRRSRSPARTSKSRRSARPRGGRLSLDGRICAAPARRGDEGAIEPVWYLPAWHGGSAVRGRPAANIVRGDRRHVLELVTRGDLDVFLPPIGGLTAYVFGKAADLARPDIRSRPVCTTNAMARTSSAPTSARAGHIWRTRSKSASAERRRRVGLIVYFRKEGRDWERSPSSSSTTPQAQQGGDRASNTSRGPSASRRPGHALSELMPMFSLARRAKKSSLVSMSNAKYDAIVKPDRGEQRLRIPTSSCLWMRRWRSTRRWRRLFNDGRVPDSGTLAKPRTRTGVSAAGRQRGRSPAPPATIRGRCASILATGLGGGLTHSGSSRAVCPRSPTSWRRSRAGVIRTRHSISQPVRHLDAAAWPRRRAWAALSACPPPSARAQKST